MKSQEFEQLRSSKGEKAAFISPKQTRAINARIDNLAGEVILEEDSCRNKHAKGTVHPLRSADAFPTTGAQPAPCPHRQQRSPLTRAISQVQTGEDATRDLPYRENREGPTDFQMRMNQMPTIWTCPLPGMTSKPQFKTVLMSRMRKESWMT